MRIFFKRAVVTAFFFFIVVLTWTILSRSSSSVNLTQTCNQLERVQQELHRMTHSVHSILQTLNVTNFLCYGSLWGQIRLSRILPWEDKTVLCILNEDISARDEVFVARMFRNRGFVIVYDSTEGLYHVYNDGFDETQQHNDNKMLKVVLVVFEMDKVVKMYRRIGWKRRVLPPDCETMTSLDCFPPRLIKPPLQRKEFGGKLVPVPREGIELQKYHYRDNWWKEITVKNC